MQPRLREEVERQFYEVTLEFADELSNAGMWEFGAFVMLHLPSGATKKKLFQDYLRHRWGA